MKNRNRAPNYCGVVKRNSQRDHVLQENCINAYVDAGNDIKGIWNYLRTVIDAGDITEPYAKIICYEAMNTIKSSERFYKQLIKGEHKNEF